MNTFLNNYFQHGRIKSTHQEKVTGKIESEARNAVPKAQNGLGDGVISSLDKESRRRFIIREKGEMYDGRGRWVGWRIRLGVISSKCRIKYL